MLPDRVCKHCLKAMTPITHFNNNSFWDCSKCYKSDQNDFCITYTKWHLISNPGKNRLVIGHYKEQVYLFYSFMSIKQIKEVYHFDKVKLSNIGTDSFDINFLESLYPIVKQEYRVDWFYKIIKASEFEYTIFEKNHKERIKIVDTCINLINKNNKR